MSKLKTIIISVAVLAGIAGIGTHIFIRVQNSAPLPKFSFDTGKSPGWVGSENVNVQAVARTTAYKGEEPIEKLPIADLTVHHGLSSSNIPEDNCFVMYSYYNYKLDDVSEAYKKYIDRKNANGQVEEFEPTKQTFSTFEGEKTYNLQQYRYTIEGQDALEGYQVGFIPLESGHLRIEGVCKTYDDLTLTLPMLQSVQLLDR